MLTRLYIDTKRRRSSGERPVEILPDSGRLDPDADLRRSLVDALAQLGSTDRAVLVLRFLLDLDVATVASTLDLTGQAVRSRTNRALARLRDELGADFPLTDHIHGGTRSMTDLAELMERATASMPVDTTRLVNGGLDRGAAEVRRRRGRVGRWTVGVAAATLLAGVVVPPLFARERHRQGAGAGHGCGHPPAAAHRRAAPALRDAAAGHEHAGDGAVLREPRERDDPAGADQRRRDDGLVQVDASVSAPYDADGIAREQGVLPGDADQGRAPGTARTA